MFVWKEAKVSLIRPEEGILLSQRAQRTKEGRTESTWHNHVRYSIDHACETKKGRNSIGLSLSQNGTQVSSILALPYSIVLT
jgi:hypothetical protein